MSERERLIKNNKFSYTEENPDFKGVDLHPELKHGPLEYRKCQDIFYLILFILFIILMAGVAIFAFWNGDPTKLATPYDPNGRQCGYLNEKGDARGFKYLYYLNPQNALDAHKFMCVKSCPKKEGDPVICMPNQQVPDCPQASYETIQIVKVCYPIDNALSRAINKFVDIGNVNEWANDLKFTWKIFIAVAFIALGISFLSLILIKYLAGCLVWTAITLYFLITTTLGVLLIVEANSFNMKHLPPSLQNKDAVNVFGGILLSLSAISFIIFVCLYKKIKIAIAVLKCSSDFVREVSSVLFVPLFQFLKAFAFFSFWITVAIFIYSCGTIKKENDTISPFGQIKWMTGVKRSFGVYILGLYWVMELIMSMGQFVIASSTAMWYFGHLPQLNFHRPVFKSYKRAYTTQFGSLCFGSLILALVRIVILMIETMHRNLKNQQQQDPSGAGKCAACCVKCAKCCVKFFEKFLRFLSEKAFIMMALEGKNFCNSAYDSFYLIMRNKAIYALVSSIGQIFVFFTMLFITVTSTFAGYLLITNIDSISSMIYEPAVPTLMFFLISYTVAYVFMQVYGMSSDALLMCLTVDREISKGLGRSVPKTLQMFVDEYLD